MYKHIRKYINILFIIFLMAACEESERFKLQYDDIISPSSPQYLYYKPTYGGARIYFKQPDDPDVLTIDVTYTTKKGEQRRFSTSYLSNSIDIGGFENDEPHTVELFAVDRAGNESEKISVTINPLQPNVKQVAESIYCIPGFFSFFVNWDNGLMQTVHVFIDYVYQTKEGQENKVSLVYTSREAEEVKLIRDPGFTGDTEVSVTICIDDEYGNSSGDIQLGKIKLMEDWLIPKDAWQIPDTNDSTIVDRWGNRINTGVPMGFFNGVEGRDYMAIDGIISDGTFPNFVHAHSKGRTGDPRDGNMPWNYIIDLGDYYELSRIVTHQRYMHSGATEYSGREDYYRDENVGIYRMWRWDDETLRWDSIRTHKITFPEGLPDRQYRVLGRQGDMAYMYPDDPAFTKPTRWFRYEALTGFGNNYQSDMGNCLSEITLYGRKAKGYNNEQNHDKNESKP